MKIIITDSYKEMSERAGNIVASQIILKPDSILGLATGSTPLEMYRYLIELYKKGVIDFQNITTFNLDEYHRISPSSPQSYAYYMMENFFNHINIPKENINIPNGDAIDVDEECREYAKKLESLGPIDLQVLGIGPNGHIGFNESSDHFPVGTHLAKLTEDTLEANSRFFDSIDDMPRTAITIGIRDIMLSKKILLLANGIGKADIIAKALKGKVTPRVPASILQLHHDVIVILDKEAASKL